GRCTLQDQQQIARNVWSSQGVVDQFRQSVLDSDAWLHFLGEIGAISADSFHAAQDFTDSSILLAIVSFLTETYESRTQQAQQLGILLFHDAFRDMLDGCRHHVPTGSGEEVSQLAQPDGGFPPVF